MRIAVIGAGKMGSWLADALSPHHELAVYDKDSSRLRYLFNTIRFVNPEEIADFKPEMLINAVSLQHTEQAFEELLPFLPKTCILADIASVKNGLHRFYKEKGRAFVSVHPMFGPTFANLSMLSRHHAIIINEGDSVGKAFFDDFFRSLGLMVHHFSFEEHDQTIAYSLSVPFASSLVFAACMQPQQAPGTTFERHLDIARALLSEDDHLLSEILFNPHSLERLKHISETLEDLQQIIADRNHQSMVKFLNKVRGNLR